MDTITYIGRKTKFHPNRPVMQVEVPSARSIRFAEKRRPKWARRAKVTNRHGDLVGLVNY